MQFSFFFLLLELTQCFLLERSLIIHSFSIIIRKGKGDGGACIIYTSENTISCWCTLIWSYISFFNLPFSNEFRRQICGNSVCVCVYVLTEWEQREYCHCHSLLLTTSHFSKWGAFIFQNKLQLVLHPFPPLIHCPFSSTFGTLLHSFQDQLHFPSFLWLQPAGHSACCLKISSIGQLQQQHWLCLVAFNESRREIVQQKVFWLWRTSPRFAWLCLPCCTWTSNSTIIP